MVVVLVLFLLLGMIAPLQAEETPIRSSLVIELQRTINAGQYGVLHVDDGFSIRNDGSSPVSSIDFGFSRVYRDKFFYAQAKDDQGKTLQLDADVNKTSEFYWMRAYFPQELGFNKTLKFTVNSVFFGLLNPVQAGFEYNFTAAPVLTQDARFANVTYVAVGGSDFRIPSKSSYRITTVGAFPALTREYKPWKAYSDETFYAPYTSVNQFILDLKWAKRDIKLGNDGSLKVADSYRFHNPSVPVTNFPIVLPEGAVNVMAYDYVGAMWTIPQNPPPPYQIALSPRYGGGIKTQGNFTFTLTYDLPQSKYLKQVGWWGSYNLTFALLNNKDDYVYEEATVNIVTPDGMKVTNLNVQPFSPASDALQVDPNGQTFRLRGATALHDLGFNVILNYLLFWSAFEPLPWIISLEVVIFAFAAYVRLTRRPELEVPAPVEKLREFVSLYDERLALSRELVAMEDEVARGSLMRHEFRRRRRVMELRLDELNRSLMRVKVELRAISQHYDDLIRRIDRAEAEVEASRASVNQLRSQYRAGKTTRETFDSMMADISKRIDRAEGTVETILITLREEAR